MENTRWDAVYLFIPRKMSKLHLSLNAPDTTLIHRAGILGLWMTLKQLEQQFPTPSQRLGMRI